MIVMPDITEKQLSNPRILHIDERYAGARLDIYGNFLYDLIVLPQRFEWRRTFEGADELAATAGGEVPSLEDFWLIKANCGYLIIEDEYWTSKSYKDDDRKAWYFYTGGGTAITDKMSLHSVIAVRKVYSHSMMP